MDIAYEDISINLHKEYITNGNIRDLFKKYDVPKEMDMLSLDINCLELWI